MGFTRVFIISCIAQNALILNKANTERAATEAQDFHTTRDGWREAIPPARDVQKGKAISLAWHPGRGITYRQLADHVQTRNALNGDAC